MIIFIDNQEYNKEEKLTLIVENKLSLFTTPKSYTPENSLDNLRNILNIQNLRVLSIKAGGFLHKSLASKKTRAGK